MEVLARPGVTERFADMLHAAIQQDIDGVAAEFGLAAGSWPFVLESITVPVRIWHGDRDRNAPIAAAHWLADQLPDPVPHRGSQEGHAPMPANQGSSIVAELTGS